MSETAVYGGGPVPAMTPSRMPARNSVARSRGIPHVISAMPAPPSVPPTASPSADILLDLLENSALACVFTDSAGMVSRWSGSAETVFGWKASEILGKPVIGLFLDARAAAEIFKPDGVTHDEVKLRTSSGEKMDAKVWVSPLSTDQKGGHFVLVLDITEKKFLEHALLEAADREQRRIGQDLHDHLCQHLLGAAFSAKALAGAMDRENSRHAPQLHDLARLINDAVSQVRDISRGLHPVELDSAGLMSALQELANRASHSVPCQFRCDKDVLVQDPEAALNAYRIAQEVVAAGLQAGASKILLSLSLKGNSICLRIANDGTIEGELTAKPLGTAAKTLYYRAQAMGGNLAMSFKPESGTIVTCQFPSKT